MTVLFVALGAAVGAPLRYLTDRFVQRRHDSVFPLGTLAVNLFGSFVLGFLYGGGRADAVSASVMTLLGTGFCGTLTTYSTFSFETVRLLQERSHFYAAASAVVSIGAGLGVAFAGAAIGKALFS